MDVAPKTQRNNKVIRRDGNRELIKGQVREKCPSMDVKDEIVQDEVSVTRFEGW